METRLKSSQEDIAERINNIAKDQIVGLLAVSSPLSEQDLFKKIENTKDYSLPVYYLSRALMQLEDSNDVYKIGKTYQLRRNGKI